MRCVHSGDRGALRHQLKTIAIWTAIRSGWHAKGKDMQLTIRDQLVGVGYVCSPNNIYGLPGSIWYAGGPGIPEPTYPHEVGVTGGSIRIFKPHLTENSCTGRARWETQTVASFDNVADFLAWCAEHGQISEPGLPAFSNSWD